MLVYAILPENDCVDVELLCLRRGGRDSAKIPNH